MTTTADRNARVRKLLEASGIYLTDQQLETVRDADRAVADALLDETPEPCAPGVFVVTHHGDEPSTRTL